MLYSLRNIIGVDYAVEKILKNQGISTIRGYFQNTRTNESRLNLSKRTNLFIGDINFWALQAEFLRIEGIYPEDTIYLIKAGFTNASQVRRSSLEKLQTILPNNSVDELKNLKTSYLHNAKTFDISGFDMNYIQTVASNNLNSKTFLTNSQRNIDQYEDIESILGFSDALSELSKGIVDAQINLNKYSIETQNKILESDELSSLGIHSTWYTIPEVEFELSLEYKLINDTKFKDFVNLNDDQRAKTKPKMVLRPISGVNNLLKKSNGRVKLKIVPVENE